MEKRPTIYSIARDVGVHPSTVSRALSRPDLVREELRERILVRAHELHYRANAVARGLTTGRTNMVGLLVPDIENPFFAPLVHAVQSKLAEHGQSILLSNSDLSAEAEVSLIEQVRSQVDALVLVSPRSHPRGLIRSAQGLPLVLVNRESTTCSTIVVDNAGILEAADLLAADGHRRFASLRGPRTSWAADTRSRATHEWADARGLQFVEYGPYEANFEGGLTAASRVAASGATAVLAFDDLMAIGAITGLARLGLRVPHDVSVVGCDDVLLARIVSPALTTVAAPFQELGDAVADILGRQLAGPGAPVHVELRGRLVVRDSTGPAPSH